MRLDHLLSKEEEVRVLYTVESWVFKDLKLNKETSEDKEFLVPMRLGDTPVPISNTMVKT